MSIKNETAYEIFVETTLTKAFPKQFPLEDLIEELNRSMRILKNFIPNQLGMPIPIVVAGGDFSIALALPVKGQGSLLGGNGIGESARLEILEKFKTAERITISSIQAGKKIAQKLEQKNMVREELANELLDVADEMITRSAIDQERKSPMTMDFPNSSQTVGSNRKGPDHVTSERKIKYTQCVIKQSLGDGEFEVETPDYLNTNDNSLVKNNLIKVSCDKFSENNYALIHLAYFFKAPFGCEGVIVEEVKTKKKKIKILKMDGEKILEVTQSNVNILRENLSLDF